MPSAWFAGDKSSKKLEVTLQEKKVFCTFALFFTKKEMYKPVFNPRNVLKFTHFTRKGYALFACLGREVIIGVLSVATLETATATSLSDETDKVTTDSTLSSRQVMLDEVSVTGTRAPLTQRQQARMVTVLSREDVQAAPVQSVNDLLKYAAGIDVRQRGALGAQTDVSIRGSNYEQITILLNGINICDPQTGHNSFDLPVDISDIERIEILEGPAGRAYGTSSLLGAVNIVTRRPSPALPVEGGGKSLTTNSLTTNSLTTNSLTPDPSPTGEGSNYEIVGEVHAEGGSYGYMSVGGRLSTPLSRWEGYGGASYARDGGVGGEAPSTFDLRPSFRSLHNSNYWNGTPYYGIGAAAHSYGTFLPSSPKNEGKLYRYWNVSDIHQYLKAIEQDIIPFEFEELNADTRYNDLITTALRTKEGIFLPSLEPHYHKYLMENAKTAINNGLLQIDDNHIHLTRQGLFVSDDVMSDLVIV